MPTEIVKYVDPDGGILADYTSLQAAITAEKAIRSDLVARDEVLKLMCISSAGSPDTTPVVIDSGYFVTDATRNIVIQGDNTTGVWDNSKYTLQTSDVCINTDGGVSLNYLQVQATGSNTALRYFQNVNNLNINGCLINNNSNTPGVLYAGALGSGYYANITNTVFYLSGTINDGTTRNILLIVQSAKSGLRLYNCTIIGALNAGAGQTVGVIDLDNGGGRGILIKNCIVQGFDNNYANIYASGSDYNQSDVTDAQMPGANSITGEAIFADAANGDFRLLAGSPGIDQGIDLSSDPSYPFNTDITGATRPAGAAWDIGAFETTNAIELILQDINIPVNLSAGVISQAHQIIADDITIPVNLDAGIITQIHQIVADSLNIPVALDNGNLTQTHILTINDMLVAVGLDNMTIISGSLVNGVAKLQLSITTPGVTPQITLPHIKMTMDN